MGFSHSDQDQVVLLCSFLVCVSVTLGLVLMAAAGLGSVSL